MRAYGHNIPKQRHTPHQPQDGPSAFDRLIVLFHRPGAPCASCAINPEPQRPWLSKSCATVRRSVALRWSGPPRTRASTARRAGHFASLGAPQWLNNSDAIVMGTTAGAVAAAPLAKRGRRVLPQDRGANGHSCTRDTAGALPLVPTVGASVLRPFIRWYKRSIVNWRLETQPPEVDRNRCGQHFGRSCPSIAIDVTSDYHHLLEEIAAGVSHSGQPRARVLDRLFALDAQLSTFLMQHPSLPPAGWRIMAQLVETYAHPPG